MGNVARNVVWRNRYFDSLKLIRISNKASALEDVEKVAVVMATPLNKQILKEAGLYAGEADNANPEDMVVALLVRDEGRLRTVLDFIEAELTREAERTRSVAGFTPKSMESALEMMPEATLSLISVPGQFAKAEAMRSLRKGLHVFLFSDNVSVAEEIELKKFAQEKGLLVMGPGCGTSLINGVALGFGNVVKEGPVGIVAASGTGIQEVASLISNAGVGISHAIGTGGRDLSDQIGGITTRQGLHMLEEDPKTQVVVLISKPPGSRTALELSRILGQMSKPTVVNFIGMGAELSVGKNVLVATTLEDAVLKAVSLVKKEEPRRIVFTEEIAKVLSKAKDEYSKFAENQQFVRGLFSGGTLCSEATLILADLISPVSSNVPPRAELKMKDTKTSSGHVCIDLGDEEFTVGRAHPMIDPFVRQQKLLQEAKDPETAVVLLDIVLGYGSHEDMAGALSETIREAKSLKEKSGGYLSVVACVVGTFEDPQNSIEQERKLSTCGVVVMPNNTQVARMATLIATRGKIKDRLWMGRRI